MVQQNYFLDLYPAKLDSSAKSLFLCRYSNIWDNTICNLII